MPTPTLSATDLLDFSSLLTDDEKAVQEQMRRFVDTELLPHVEKWDREHIFPAHIPKLLGSMGLLGATLHTHGCAGMNPVAYGLALAELERADSALRSFSSVQSSLVMYAIHAFGSDAQRDRWLPTLRTGEQIGCFGLTEPDAGSDPANMRTRAIQNSDGTYTLRGHKRWITNGTIADVAVIWAREIIGGEEGQIRGFLVEKGTDGFIQQSIKEKQSFYMSDTAELILEDVVVPATSLMPRSKNIGSALACLSEARFGILWGVLGAATQCLDVAVRYAQERPAFGRPLAGFQLVQHKLVQMASELAQGQLLAHRLATLKIAKKLQPAHISLGKMNNVQLALSIARLSRDILGANGIADAYPVMRHMRNLETVYTYEGTHDIHVLVLGHAITGEAAFRG